MKWFNRIVYVIILLAIGFLAGFFIDSGITWSGKCTFLSIISAAGAFGGLLYTARDSGLELLHRNPEKKMIINLGWIADCAFGIAGAYVVFLLLPTELMSSEANGATTLTDMPALNLIKLLALALVGGYGGRSLVDTALSNLKKDIKNVRQEAADAKEKIDQIQEIDTEAKELVTRQFDEGESLKDIQKLKETIQKASKNARFEIFKEARAFRKKCYDDKKFPLMKRTIPVFEALINNEAGEQYHRNHAQLAYALKDQGGDNEAENEWQKAYDELGKAIALRDKEGVEGFFMYEFNRALCGMKLGIDNSKILEDVKKAKQDDFIVEIIKKDKTTQEWVSSNKIKIN